MPFDYPVPDGMIEDPVEREAMIGAKIAHLQEVNRLFWGDAPGTPEERQAIFDELWSTIDAHFVAFNRLDLDWDAFYEEYFERIGGAQSYGEYAHIITLMGYSLKWFTREDVINGIDTVREYAFHLIREARGGE